MNEIYKGRSQYKKLQREFEQYKKESVKWSVEDFTGNPNYKISKTKAQQALEHMMSKHDATLGITWDTVECYLDMYGKRIKNNGI